MATPPPVLNNVKLLQETSVVHPHRTVGYHGETINFTIDFRNYGAALDLAGATATLYWRVPGDAEGYWHQAEATCAGSTASWTWDASMDNGESPVLWFLQVVDDDANGTTSYRATGEIRLLASPGFVPAVVPPARITLDFDYINVLHAPYWTKEEADGRFAGEGDIPAPSTADPQMDGAASAGSSEAYARGDHRHPTDTSRAASSDIALEAAAFSGWEYTIPAGFSVAALSYFPEIGKWAFGYSYDASVGGPGGGNFMIPGDGTELELSGIATVSGVDYTLTATRAATAYRLGPDAAANPNRGKTLAPADAIPAVVAPSTSSSDAGKAADAKATGDALAEKLDKSGGTMTGILTAPQFYATGSGNSFVIAPGEGMATTLEHPGIITVTEQTGANTIVVFVPGTVAAASNPAKTLALLADLPDPTLHPYAAASGGIALAPGTAVYRAALGADGTFPAVSDTAIPSGNAYYAFEIELAIPATVPASITGPTGWTWLEDGELPAPSDLSGGETVYIAVRLDCATGVRAYTANVWRVA